MIGVTTQRWCLDVAQRCIRKLEWCHRAILSYTKRFWNPNNVAISHIFGQTHSTQFGDMVLASAESGIDEIDATLRQYFLFCRQKTRPTFPVSIANVR